MPPHLTPRRSECTAPGIPEAEHSNAWPASCPRHQRADGHSRSYSQTSITASQANRMLLHVVPGQPACLNSQSPHKLPPETPRPIGPHAEGTQPEAGCLSSQAVAFIRLVAACDSFSGRKPSASIVPPASWPCCPSTFRLSRSPQPSSRRIAVWPLLAPAYSLQAKQLKGVRYAHLVHSPPPGPFRPPGGGSVGFAAARRRARGSACKTRRGKFPPTPLIARAKPAAAAFRRKRDCDHPAVVAGVNRISRRQASRAPPSAPRPSAARSAQACPTLGSAESTAKPLPHASAE